MLILNLSLVIFRLLKLAQDREFVGLNLRQGESVNSITSETIADLCPFTNSRKPKCSRNDKFRTIDGSCNNLVRSHVRNI